MLKRAFGPAADDKGESLGPFVSPNLPRAGQGFFKFNLPPADKWGCHGLLFFTTAAAVVTM